MATTDVLIEHTVLGDVRVRSTVRRRVTAEDVVEINTRHLLATMKLEARRRALANGGNGLDEITYYRGRL